MWRLTSLFVFLSMLVSIWLLAELGVFSSAPVMASEKAEHPAAASSETSIDEYQKTLIEKNKLLEKRETELNKRETSVAEKEKLVSQQLNRYEGIIQELKTKLAELETTKASQAESFRQIYEKMDPKKAARILDDLELGLTSQIIAGMKQEKAAEILGQMSKEKARQVTERYLSRLSKQVSTTKVGDQANSNNSKGGEQ